MDIPIQPNVSGQILAGGISNAANSIADNLTQYAGILKQTKAYRAMAVDGLGMDPDQVDKMSLPELQGHMQGVALKAEQQQRQAQIYQMMSHGDYFRGMNDWRQQEAAGAAGASKFMSNLDSNPDYTKTLTPNARAFLHSGAMMGAANPQVGKDLLDRFMAMTGNGESGRTPTFGTTPGGNRFITYGNEFQWDRPPLDINALMQNAPPGKTPLPTGKGGVTWKDTIKPLPGTYETRLSNTAGNGLADQLGLLQQSANQSDDEILARPTIAGDKGKLATFRKNNASQIQSLTKQIQNHLDSYRSQGYGSPDFWQGEYKRYDLTPPAGAPAASRDAGTPAAVSSPAARVPVWGKDGSAFTVPADQLDQALAAGYLDQAPTE